MKRVSLGQLGLLSVLLGALSATPGAQADAVSAVQVLREGGCAGTSPPAPLLRHDSMLDRAAAQWAAGSTLAAAAEGSAASR